MRNISLRNGRKRKGEKRGKRRKRTSEKSFRKGRDIKHN